ncbi:DUF397 domain-containing protein [Sphaerisporangium fuscum]|uniref:DUF397 domain-containing protein n=1 Tax=Sphaerisporangium fuscum TaxID=2835868 RepID=UPI0027E3A3A7|nr:DUF397 domain-containing protein [Sphaerisporangium fuscum]
MNEPKIDIYAYDLFEARWRKSSASAAENDCVEIADLPGGARAIRDSKNPSGGVLRTTASEWKALRVGIQTGALRPVV